MRVDRVDVLVVGIGPSGLVSCGLLAAEGVKVMGLSKYAGPAPTPRATVANARSMEVYRDMGIEHAIQDAGVPMQSLLFNVFATALNGVEFARYRSYGTAAERMSDYETASPCKGWNIAQNRLEPVLAEAARVNGADLRYSHEMITIEQSDDEVTARIRDRETGEEYLIKARYAIGADGGRSQVAEQIGFRIAGEATEKTLVSMWLEADLSKYAEYRPAYLFNIFRPGPHQWFGSANWLCVTPYKEWLVTFPGTTDLTEEALLERARETIGDPDVSIKVKQTYDWRVNQIYAEEYRKGRVFISGDAAHRHPPAGGLGANTSIQDSFNLAWKLAYVVKGLAGDGLLDSYHAERQPVGKHLVERANKSLANNAPIPMALGWTDEMPIEEGWDKLNTLFDDTPEAAERRRLLDEAVTLGNYRSNAIGMELGQRYRSGAIADNGQEFPEPTRDPELFYEPTSTPGAYIPHAWIEFDRHQISTLDIVGKGSLTLITGLGGAAWERAAEAVSTATGVPIAVRRIGLGCKYNDLTGDWGRVAGLGDHGALLVRPDRWVAWRSLALPSDPEECLENALRTILTLPGKS